MRRRPFLGVAGTSLIGGAGCLGRPEYTVTDVSVDAGSVPFAFSVERTEPHAVVEHPATLTFSLSNEGERPLRIRNTGIWPFGLLELVASIDAEEAGGTILWTDQYAESEEVDATSRRDYGATSTPLVRALDPGERVSETYELHGDSLGGTDTGVQFVRGEFDPPILEYAGDPRDDWEPFLPRVRVSIEEKGLL